MYGTMIVWLGGCLIYLVVWMAIAYTLDQYWLWFEMVIAVYVTIAVMIAAIFAQEFYS
jgi:hypothetical protein